MKHEHWHEPINRKVLDELALKVLNLASMPPDKRRNRNGYKELRSIVGDSEVDAIVAAANPAEETRLLRATISRYLKGGKTSPELKASLADWIVASWGSVTQGRAKIPAWIRELGAFDEVSIDAFKTKVVHQWMSSWTKILSFSDYQRYPVFDTNNATALNVLMEPISTSNFFFMPEGRATFVKAARAKLIRKHKTGRGEYPDLGGYIDYEYLIEQVTQRGGLSDKLAAEQLLFTRAVGVARDYLTRAEQETALAKARADRARQREAKKAKEATKEKGG